MAIRKALRELQAQMKRDSQRCYLVCWEDEGASFSVINKHCFPEVETQEIRVGEVYTVCYMRKPYKARVAAVGSKEEMNELLNDPDFEPVWSNRDASPPPPYSLDEIGVPSSPAPPSTSIAPPSAPTSTAPSTMASTVPSAPTNTSSQGKENTLWKKRKTGTTTRSQPAKKKRGAVNIQTIISVTPHGGEPPNSIAPTGQEVDEVPNSPAPDPAPHTPTDPIVPDSPPPIEDDINMGTDDLQQTIDHQQVWGKINTLERKMESMQETQHRTLMRLYSLENSLSSKSSYSPFYQWPGASPHFHTPPSQSSPFHLPMQSQFQPPTTPVRSWSDHQPQLVTPQTPTTPTTGPQVPTPASPTTLAETTLRLELRKPKHASMPPLPSDAIDKENLQSVEAVLVGKAVTESVAPTIAQLLVREAFFGESILAKCTPLGSRAAQALPRKELLELKRLMFTKLPGCQGSFEALWGKCMTAIEQACKRARKRASAITSLTVSGCE